MNTAYVRGWNARGRDEALDSAPRHGPLLNGKYPSAIQLGSRADMDMQYEYWWRAGWHDRDMEIGRSEQGLRKAEAV